MSSVGEFNRAQHIISPIEMSGPSFLIQIHRPLNFICAPWATEDPQPSITTPVPNLFATFHAC